MIKIDIVEQLADAFLNGDSELRFVYNRMTQEIDVLEPFDHDWEDDEHLELIPCKDSREMYEVMVEFSQQFEGEIEQALFLALNGRKPFLAFKDAADKVGVLNQWYDFEYAYAKEQMRKWLKTI